MAIVAPLPTSLVQLLIGPRRPTPIVGAPGVGERIVNPPPEKFRPATYCCSSGRKIAA
jgi:hypothetical protein